MGKYKKKLRQEKSKVQLKKSEKTKFLPKGQNVTNTAFKVKAIVLPDQLKLKDVDVPLSKRKLDVKDLLQRMRHYNENVRHKACLEMVDMMKFHHLEIIKTHLPSILQVVPTLIQDKFSNVRRSSIKVIDALLSRTNCSKIEPFFDFISVNLRCAMTNINRDIQEDSLLLLDVLLKYTQPLLAKNYMKILSDFFTLISKLRSDSKFGKTLTVDLGRKLTSVNWRLQALSRLNLLLIAIITETCKTKQTEKERVCCYDDPKFNPLYVNPLADVNLNRNFNSKDKQTVLDKHLGSLVQLLYETWIEVAPDKVSQTERTILNDESASLLRCIMRILKSLFTYVQLNNSDCITAKDIFLTPEGTKFLNFLIKSFPYSQGQTVKAKKKIDVIERNTDPKCMEQNLLICYIYCMLKLDQKGRDKNIVTAVSSLNKILFNESYPYSDNIGCIVLLLESILCKDTKKWVTQKVNVEEILENVIRFYENSRLNEEVRSAIFGVLANIPDNNPLKEGLPYANWVKSIVQDLLKPKISSVKINFLLNLAKQNNLFFLGTFLNNLGRILGNLNDIEIIGNGDRKTIINIFYYLPMDGNHLKTVQTFLASKNYVFTPYLEQIVSLNINKN